MITQTYLFSLIQRYTHYIIFFTVNFPPKTTNTRNMKKLLRRWSETNMMAQAGMTGFLFYQYLAWALGWCYFFFRIVLHFFLIQHSCTALFGFLSILVLFWQLNVLFDWLIISNVCICSVLNAHHVMIWKFGEKEMIYLQILIIQ